MIQSKVFISTACAILLGTSAINAQPAVDDGWEWDATAGAGYYGKGSLRGTGSDVDGAFLNGEISASGTTANNWRISSSLSFARWEADFSEPINFGPATGRPFDLAEEFGVSASAFYRIDDKWSFGAFGDITWARAVGAPALSQPSWSQSDTQTIAMAAIYNWTQQLSLTFGVLYSSSLEDDDLLVPILGLRYRHSDALTLRVLDASGIFDLDLIAIDYQPVGEQDIHYSFSLQWANDDYRLGGLTDGSGRRVAVADEAFRLLASATWTVSDRLALTPYAGYDFRRDMEFISNEDTLADFRVRNSWILGIQAAFAF